MSGPARARGATRPPVRKRASSPKRGTGPNLPDDLAHDAHAERIRALERVTVAPAAIRELEVQLVALAGMGDVLARNARSIAAQLRALRAGSGDELDAATMIDEGRRAGLIPAGAPVPSEPQPVSELLRRVFRPNIGGTSAEPRRYFGEDDEQHNASDHAQGRAPRQRLTGNRPGDHDGKRSQARRPRRPRS